MIYADTDTYTESIFCHFAILETTLMVRHELEGSFGRLKFIDLFIIKIYCQYIFFTTEAECGRICWWLDAAAQRGEDMYAKKCGQPTWRSRTGKQLALFVFKLMNRRYY